MTAMKGEAPRVGQGFQFRWALVNAVGFAIGGALGGGLARAAGQPFYGNVTSPSEGARINAMIALLALGVWGLGIGTMQWLVLRHRLARAGWWVPATIGGWAIGGAVGGGLSGAIGGAVTEVGPDLGPIGFVVAAMAGVLAIGLLPGLFQWLVLRRQADRAGQWVLANFISSGVAAALAAPALLVIANLLGLGLPSAGAWGLCGVLMGLLFGVSSSPTLKRVLPQPALQAHAGPDLIL